VNMFFIRVMGINTATVSAHAKAGFGVLGLDAALAIDATGSMDDGCNSSQDNAGCPIHEAKEAAMDFKDVLLGTSPDGSTSIGVTAFRGCFRANPQTATAPMSLSSKTLCVRDDDTTSTWVTDLSYSLSTLNSRIGNIMSEGGSGTNVCGGMAKAWEILEGPGNHLSEENHLRYAVLLSDGDNNYYGQYIYQSSPYASPHTYQSNPCQPPSSCTNVGGESSSSSTPCHNGVHVPQTDLATETFNSGSGCTGSWSSGSGWTGAWTPSPSSGTDTPTRITTTSPQGGSCHVRIYGIGSLTRAVDLTTAITPSLTYYAKYGSWESGDDAMLQVSTSASGPWTTLYTHTSSNTGTSYGGATSIDLNSYVGSTIYIRFQGSMSSNSTSDQFYIDTITVTTGMPGSSNGYLNGQDSSPVGCSSARPRERQMDLLTWDMVKAMEADDVEIFVVGFGTCDPGSAVYTDAQCDAQIGNTDHDNTADERLLKCIASSKPTTNDHYFYASNAEDLPAIFTQIAQQIAHRLIE
ncbi:MAG TPA: hypothetical protein VFX19_05360, partial [Dehalococcoidia bacterium]|nr:hypothetical protein [Dehalococcoidia bacterium]